MIILIVLIMITATGEEKIATKKKLHKGFNLHKQALAIAYEAPRKQIL